MLIVCVLATVSRIAIAVSAKPMILAVHCRLRMATSTSFYDEDNFLPQEARERAVLGNMFEKVKARKGGAFAWADVHDYAAAIRSGQINWDDIETDDIDIRFKYSGAFHRRKATPGRFMLRLRLPNGIISSDQLRYCSSMVRPHGPNIGVLDITTRANLQLRGLTLEDCSDAIKGLQARGLTSLMSGMDNVRNVVGSPLAGIDPHEIYDTRALAKEIDSWYTQNGTGNAKWSNLPRKFNIAISGSRDDFAHTRINDIGLDPVPHAITGAMGFNVVLGGYLSAKRCVEAVPSGVWIPAHLAVALCDAVLTLFRDLGPRGDRQKTRLRWLIEEQGLQNFVNNVVAKMQSHLYPTPCGEAIGTDEGVLPTVAAHGETKGQIVEWLAPAQEHTGALAVWDRGHRSLLGVHPQRQPGKSWVGIHVPVGRLSVDECDELAYLADKYSEGEIRLTVDQNILLPHVDTDAVNRLLREPALTRTGSRLSVDPGHIVGHVVSCTGAQFCGLALVETKLKIDAMTRKLDEMMRVPRPVRIHVTGCPNSCAQAQIADIGLVGAPARKADADGVMKAVSGVHVFVGGAIGEGLHIEQAPVFRSVPFTDDDLLPLMVELLVERFGGEKKVSC